MMKEKERSNTLFFFVCIFSKLHPQLHFFAKKFAHVKKKQYLCTRNRKDMNYGLAPVKQRGQRRGATFKE